MDDKRFDDLSKVLGTAFTRQGVYKFLAGLSAAGVSAITGLELGEAKKGKGHAGKHHNNTKGKAGHDNGHGGSNNAAQAEGKKHKGKGKHKKKKKQPSQNNSAAAVCDPRCDNGCTRTAGQPCNFPPGNNCCQTQLLCIGDRIGGGSGRCGECDPGTIFCPLPDQPGLCVACPAGQEPDPNQACKCVCKSGSTECGDGCCDPATETCCDDVCVANDSFCGGTCKVCDKGQTCCADECISSDQCCQDDDCAEKLCQNRDCTNDHTCNYTPVDDGKQGPLCTGEGEFCCNGDDCCEAGDVCTENGCCTPRTCPAGRCGDFPDGCGNTLHCTCGAGETCCGDGTCISDDQCCADGDCDEKTCQEVDCVDHECDYTPVKDGDPGPLCDDPGEFCCNGRDCCKQGQKCIGSGCCTPKTCADYPGQCGSLEQGCGLPNLDCGCGNGRCCGGRCVTGNQCCNAGNCDEELCQIAACNDGSCGYTPVDNGDQGPLCDDQGEFCCNGNACCKNPQVCTGEGCCTPKTCADYPGQCGSLPQGCGLPNLNCGCGEGQGCCDGRCVEGNECCVDPDCDPVLCQIASCNSGDCGYTPVDNGDQGPLCEGQGQFCCNGNDCCEAGDVCTGQGCCTPKTCAAGQCGDIPDGCGGTLHCTCSEGQGCCDGTCVGDDECCAADDCDEVVCQVPACDDGACEYTKVDNGDQGPLCDDDGEFCCNGNDCCEAGDVCTGQGCCTPKTCADFQGKCGQQDDGCGGILNCTCPEGQGCCNGTCVEGEQCCADEDCPAEICQTVTCDGGDCDYTPVNDNEQGPLCDDEGEFCCKEECCEAGDVCTGEGCCTPKTCADFPGQCGPLSDGCGGNLNCACPQGQPCLDNGTCCVPDTKEQACQGAGRVCGEVADGCGGTYDCGACSSGQTCTAGVCLASGGKKKRCKGNGLAGQPCKGKKCKCKGGRKCHNGRCCEKVGDGSKHCNADSDCCPGLACRRRQPGQHKVCVQKPVNANSVAPAPTTTPGLAIGAAVTGLLMKGASRLFGTSSSNAEIAIDDLVHPHGDQQL